MTASITPSFRNPLTMTTARNVVMLPTACCLLALGFAASAGAQTPGMVEFLSHGKLRKGMLLVDLAHEYVVIGRDGWLHSLDPRSPKMQIRRLDEPYQPASAAELRNQLLAEFLDGLED